MTALIDADSLLYKYAFTNQKSFRWSDDCVSTHTDLTAATEELDKCIERTLKETKADDYICYLTEGKNFRYEVLPTYKSNRKAVEKPVLFYPLKEYLIANYNVKVVTRIEADDAVVIKQTKDPKNNIACHIDKDLDQAWGDHYNYNTRQFYSITREEADYWFYMQTLTGDSTDGYKGCPGIGKVKAEKLLDGLETEEEVWEAIVEAYAKKGLTEEDALQQARVARMLRYTDWDWKKKEIILWEAPSLPTSAKEC